MKNKKENITNYKNEKQSQQEDVNDTPNRDLFNKIHLFEKSPHGMTSGFVTCGKKAQMYNIIFYMQYSVEQELHFNGVFVQFL